MKLYRTLAVFAFVLTSIGSHQLFADGDCFSSWTSNSVLEIGGDRSDNELEITQRGDTLYVTPLNGTTLDGRTRTKTFGIKPGLTDLELKLSDGSNGVTVYNVTGLRTLDIQTGIDRLGHATIYGVMADQLYIQGFMQADVDHCVAPLLGVDAESIRGDSLTGTLMGFVGWEVEVTRVSADDMAVVSPQELSMKSFSVSLSNISVSNELFLDELGPKLVPNDRVSLHHCEASMLNIVTESGDDSLEIEGGYYDEIWADMGHSNSKNVFVANGVEFGELEVDSEDNLVATIEDCIGEDLEVDNSPGNVTKVNLNNVVMSDDILIDTGNGNSYVRAIGVSSEYFDVFFGQGNDTLAIYNSTAYDSILDGDNGFDNLFQSNFEVKILDVQDFEN
jgi:hypothetical protein